MMTAAGMPLDHATGLLTTPHLSQYKSLTGMSTFPQSPLNPTSALRFCYRVFDFAR
jgi:hypothetical protein